MQPSLAVILREKIGSDNTHYVHGLRGVQSQVANSAWTEAMSDGLGSVRGWLNSSQAFTDTNTFDPYGVPDSAVTGFGFTGEMTDDNGLVYLRARYYQPNIGNFVSLDPFEGFDDFPMSLNGYSWVEGNPMNRTDPSGKVYWSQGRENIATFNPGYGLHLAIQTIAMAVSPTSIHAEYPVDIGFFRADDNHYGSEYNVLGDLAGLTAKYLSYLDLLDEATGGVWEIKPKYAEMVGLIEIIARRNLMEALQKAGRLQGNDHPITGYYNWNNAPNWVLGNSPMWQYPVFLGTDPTGWISFYAKQSQQGVIVWWTVKNQERRTESEQIIRVPNAVAWNPQHREEKHPETVYIPERGLVPNPAYAYVVSIVATDLSGLWNPEISSNYAPRPGTLCSGSCHYPGYSRPSANAELSQAYAQPFLALYESLFWLCLTAGGSYIIGGLSRLPGFAFP